MRQNLGKLFEAPKDGNTPQPDQDMEGSDCLTVWPTAEQCQPCVFCLCYGTQTWLCFVATLQAGQAACQLHCRCMPHDNHDPPYPAALPLAALLLIRLCYSLTLTLHFAHSTSSECCLCCRQQLLALASKSVPLQFPNRLFHHAPTATLQVWQELPKQAWPTFVAAPKPGPSSTADKPGWSLNLSCTSAQAPWCVWPPAIKARDETA